MPDTGHFFHRRLIDLRGAIKNGVKNLRRRSHECDRPDRCRRRPMPQGVAPALAGRPGAAAGAARTRPHPRTSCSAAREAGWREARSGEPVPVHGLYLWGGVGRGKTFLVDLLFDALAIAAEAPHAFPPLHARGARAAARTPASAIRWRRSPGMARRDALAGAGRVLRQRHRRRDDPRPLARPPVRRGVTLVTTSNTAPHELYRDGLQRASFLPAIALIEEHCAIVQARQRAGLPAAPADQRAGLPAPLGAQPRPARRALQRARAACRRHGPCNIRSSRDDPGARRWPRAWPGSSSPRCAKARARAPTTSRSPAISTPCCLSACPRFDRDNEDAARRFVHLVDEFYDRHVNLSAPPPPSRRRCTRATRMEREFERTGSRLIEMQSAEYLASSTRPDPVPQGNFLRSVGAGLARDAFVDPM